MARNRLTVAGRSDVLEAQIVRPDDTYRLEEALRTGQVVVVQKEKPWGWIIFGVVSVVFMLLTFLSWAVGIFVGEMRRSAERSHETAMKALDTVASVEASNSMSPEAFVFLVGGVLFLYLLLKAKVK